MYACRVVQALVRNYGDGLNINRLFVEDNHLSLSRGKFGNYCIQCFIRRNEWYSEQRLIKRFRNRFILDVFHEENILSLSKNKFGSNVIERCIEAADVQQIRFLNAALCANRGFLLNRLMFHRFGNYIPRTLLENVSGGQRRKLVRTVHAYIVNLTDSRLYEEEQSHGASFIQSCQQIKYEMDRVHRASGVHRRRGRRQNY